MAETITVTVTTIPTLTGDTVASYTVHSDQDGQLDTMSTTEAAAGHDVDLSLGATHSITVKAVWTTAGATTTVGSNAVSVTTSAAENWDISAYSDASKETDVSANHSSPRNPNLSPDGTKMLIPDYTDALISQYTLGTPYDVGGTVTFVRSLSTGTQPTNPVALGWNFDGTKMFVLSSSKRWYEWNLPTTDYNTLDAVYSGSNNDISANMTSVCWGGCVVDGTMLFSGGAGGEIVRYDLPTESSALATATFTSRISSLTEIVGNVNGLGFNDDGTIMYVLDSDDETIHQYTLSIGYDLGSTVTYASKLLDTSTVVTGNNTTGFWFDGNRLLAGGSTDDIIVQFEV